MCKAEERVLRGESQRQDAASRLGMRWLNVLQYRDQDSAAAMRYWNLATSAVPGMGDFSEKTRAGSGEQPTIVALTGFMGSGKSSVGRELASLLGWELVDLDAVIEEREQRTVREIFRQAGETAFREMEHAALKAYLEQCNRPTVVALGGGAFVQPRNAELLRTPGTRTVFLEVPVEELLRRCAVEDAERGEGSRPLASEAASFRELYERRLPAYRRADIVVDATAKDAREVAHMIAKELQP